MPDSAVDAGHSTIGPFEGEYRFLSNFYTAPIVLLGRTWMTNEHAFQGLKTFDAADRDRIVAADTPGHAKRLGRQVRLRNDWENVKGDVMLLCVRAKFTQHGDLAAKLLATGDAPLEEANNWGDREWGTVDGSGKNRLGLTLMQVRDELASLAPRPVHATGT